MQTISASITLEELKKDMQAKNERALIFFTADWSGTSSIMKPAFEFISKELESTLSFFWLDLEVHQQLAADLNIHKVPSIFFFRNHELIGHVSGILPRFQLIRQIAFWLNLPPDHPLLLLANPEVQD